MLNVAYMDGKANFSQDPEPYRFEQIYQHIDQLTPVLAKNSDQIHSVQAGFLGNVRCKEAKSLLGSILGVLQHCPPKGLRSAYCHHREHSALHPRVQIVLTCSNSCMTSFTYL